MNMATDPAVSHPFEARSTAALTLPGVLAFTVPVLGFLVSLLLPLLAARFRLRLWPETSPTKGHVCAALAVAGLWLPALIAVGSSGRLGSTATTWLLVPLCAPLGAAALLVPSLAAVVVYVSGVAVGIRLRSPWPWVLGAWSAPLAYVAATRWLVDFVCFA